MIEMDGGQDNGRPKRRFQIDLFGAEVVTQTCKYCGRWFKPTWPGQLYCHPWHRRAAAYKRRRKS